jgi:predicted porin
MNTRYAASGLSIGVGLGLTLALGTTSVQAQSSVTIYGIVGTQAVYATGITKRKALDTNTIYASRLGFKGSEDLGGGLSAFFGLETALGVDTGAAGGGSSYFNRGSFVGIGSSTYGKLSLGRQWDLEDDFLCGLYVCGGNAAFYSFPGFGNTSDLINNAVKYTQPTLGGLNGGVMVAPGEGTTGRYAAIVETYTAGPVTVGAGYDTQRNLAGKTDKLAIVAAKYEFGVGFARASYISSKPDASALGKAAAYDVGVGFYATPAATVSVDYAAMDRKNSPNDANFVRVVGVYNLSKRTNLNANLIHLKNKGASNIGLFGAAVAPGNSQNVVTLGIAHSF